MNEFYIFTEIVGCGKIGRIAIDSFHKYHNQKIHIYGTKEDFKHIKENENNVFIEISNKVQKKFKMGHWGTAFLWEEIITTIKSKYFIHFDSDVIFRGNMIDELILKAKEGYGLIGPRRNYHSNRSGRDDVRFLTDLCQTSLILFDKTKISTSYIRKYSIQDFIKSIVSNTIINGIKNFKNSIKNLLESNIDASKFCRMIHGTYSPFLFPHIDFFDPVMFDMINNGAKIFYLDPKETGTHDFYGRHTSELKIIDFGTKLIHFSGVGSGLNFIDKTNNIKGVSASYKKHCIDKYKLFCKIFYNEQMGAEDSNRDLDDALMVNNWY